jgi:hypothetical protein
MAPPLVHLKAAREDSSHTERLVHVTASDTKEGSMSEQDRVDSPEHDDVEAHKRHMTDDADSTTESDEVEAHGHGGSLEREGHGGSLEREGHGGSLEREGHGGSL